MAFVSFAGAGASLESLDSALVVVTARGINLESDSPINQEPTRVTESRHFSQKKWRMAACRRSLSDVLAAVYGECEDAVNLLLRLFQIPKLHQLTQHLVAGVANCRGRHVQPLTRLLGILPVENSEHKCLPGVWLEFVFDQRHRPLIERRWLVIGPRVTAPATGSASVPPGGIRHFFFDLGKGLELPSVHRSNWYVIGASVVLTLLTLLLV